MNTSIILKIKSRGNIILMLSFLCILILAVPVIAAAKPVILYTDILTGPNTGGENNKGIYLSIFGKNFGKSSDLGINTKVYINNTEVAAYKYLGQSYGRQDIQQISIQPGPSVSSGAIKVVVNGTESNTDKTFTVKPGDIYYIDNVVGNQSTGVAGDISKPFRNPQKTLDDFIGPGNYMVLRGTGTDWTMTDNFLKISGKLGEQNNYYGIMGYPGEAVTLSRPVTQNAAMISISGTTNGYFSMSNFRTKSVGYKPTCGRTVINANAGSQKSYIRFVNLFISGSQSDCNGNLNPAVNNLKVLGVHMYNNGMQEKHTLTPSMIYITGGSDIEIAWNHFEKQTFGKGVRIRASSPSANLIFHDNIMNDVYSSGFWLARGATTGHKAYNNIFYNVGHGAGGSYSYNVMAANEINSEIEASFNNNIILVNNPQVTGISAAGSDLDLKNNIIYVQDNLGNYFSGGGGIITGSNNIYYGSTKSLPSWDTNPINEDPLFINLDTYDFHLQENSPAIDNGTYISLSLDSYANPRPMDGDNDGTATIDIGATEYTGTYIPPHVDSTTPSPPIGLKKVMK